MRNLVLAMIAGASLAAGCGGGGDDVGQITANWSFTTVAGANITECPPGFDTAAVTATPIDDVGTPIGDDIVDLYDCGAFTGTSDYPLDVYRVFTDITNNAGTNSYGTTLSATVDIIDQDQTYTAELVDDGGYFGFGWELKNQAGQIVECDQVNGGIDGVEIVSTLNGPNTATTDQYDCADHGGVTSALLAGTYTLSLNGFLDADGRITDLENLNAEVINNHNAVTDLGTVELTLTAQ